MINNVYSYIYVTFKPAVTDFLGHLGAAEATCKHIICIENIYGEIV